MCVHAYGKGWAESKKRKNSVVVAKTLHIFQAEENITSLEVIAKVDFSARGGRCSIEINVAEIREEYGQEVPIVSCHRTACERAREEKGPT